MSDKSRRFKQFIDSFLYHLNRLEAYMESDLSKVKIKALELRLSELNTTWDNYKRFLPPYDKFDEDVLTVEIRESIEESYYSLRPLLEEKIDEVKAKKLTKKEDIASTSTTFVLNPKLPDISLDEFDGDYLKWNSFIGSFNSLVHNNNSLTTLAKFQYLKRSVKGAAALAIESLDFTEANYTVAHELLKERFDKPNFICDQHIRALFSFKAIEKPSSSRLIEIVDHFKSHLRSLESLGRPVNRWDDLIVFMIVSKLDAETKSRWTDEAPSGHLPTLENLCNFLNIRAHKLETQANNLSNPSITNKSNFRIGSRGKSSASHNAAKSSYQCFCCKKFGHTIIRCRKFLTLQVTDRKKFVDESKLCHNCLHSGHDTMSCPNNDRCRHCQQPHHSLLHTSNQLIAPKGSTNPQVQTSASSSLNSANPRASSVTFVYLATALVRVLDKYNKPVIGRALLDSGSQISFISESFASKLQLPRFKSSSNITGIGSGSISVSAISTICVQSLHNAHSITLDVFIIPKISCYKPPDDIKHIENWTIPSNINLADPEFFKSRNIDLLIGAEVYHELLSVGQIKLDKNLPTLQNTLLGWIITGKLSAALESSNTACHIANAIESDELKDVIEKFWCIENLPHSIKQFTTEENLCEAHFQKFTSRNSDGRFEVVLPFSSDPNTSLGESFNLARRRFYNLERRLHKTPDLLQSYTEFINEYISLGHMSLFELSIDSPYYCLPHHCVLKPDSSSTKLRVVFDASAKTSNGKSLNSILRVGPTIQNELFAILLKFRTHKFVFSADITKMYRQVNVWQDHRKFQLILWRENPSLKLQTYCLNTVTYGTSSASYLATRCLTQLARDFSSIFPEAASRVENDFYVDDLLTGADSLDKAINLKREIQNILQSGCMDLRKWCANHPSMLVDIPIEHQESFLKINEDEVVKTLGILWHPTADRFSFIVNLNPQPTVSKRSIFSQVARIYDPLGLLSPVVMIGKLMIQMLWQLKLHWDEAVPMHLHAQWIDYREELLLLSQFSVDRHIFSHCSNAATEIHGFSDASEKGYGAVLYIRNITDSGSVSTNLLCSKSRMAPLKKLTIPRLELCGALLLAELYNKCITILNCSFTDAFLWSDSTITLHWIKGDASRWKTFVSNRVGRIQQLTSKEQWCHVSSENNPADLISRGVKASKLIHNQLWLHGPAYLVHPKEFWPEQIFEICDEYQLELSKRSSEIVLTADTCSNDDLIMSTKFSNNFLAVIRVMCYLMRFKTKSKGVLSVEELNNAEMVILKYIQRKSFPDVYDALSEPHYEVKNSKLKSLSLFLDDNKVIRVGGRLQHTSLAYHTKHPILLPSSHPFTITIISFFHRTNHHAGPLALLAVVRDKFWPINGRSLCAKVYRSCITCFKVNPRRIQQQLGSLPIDRVNVAPPFHSIGIDFCGPFYAHYRMRGKQPTKTYVCVFVCFVSKAIHLEVASDLSTSSFIGAFKRMIASRGIPKRVTSDNGTNFVGANTYLHELYTLLQSSNFNEEVRLYCQANRIEWNFIPPYTPNFGGLHEASVKLFKFHLRRSMGTAKFTYEQLQTIVKEIEAILNSRPITPLSSSPDDLNCLTPGEILIGRPLTSLPSPGAIECSAMDTWKYLEFVRSTFWKRWSLDYLRAQQQRHQWPKQSSNVKIGDMVLLIDENLPPLYWKLGRVMQLFPGQDGLVRVVQLKTAKGETTRGVTKICPLPLTNVETTA